jgi:hypothetical protein
VAYASRFVRHHATATPKAQPAAKGAAIWGSTPKAKKYVKRGRITNRATTPAGSGCQRCAGTSRIARVAEWVPSFWQPSRTCVRGLVRALPKRLSRRRRLPENDQRTDYADLDAGFPVHYADFRPLLVPSAPLRFGGSRAGSPLEVPVLKGLRAFRMATPPGFEPGTFSLEECWET